MQSESKLFPVILRFLCYNVKTTYQLEVDLHHWFSSWPYVRYILPRPTSKQRTLQLHTPDCKGKTISNIVIKSHTNLIPL